uniref:Alpha/beta hydrolase n=1 Tax=Schlesneria paludicola TaxID=360056 RepID=A0A7C4QIG6_9PLAN
MHRHDGRARRLDRPPGWRVRETNMLGVLWVCLAVEPPAEASAGVAPSLIASSMAETAAADAPPADAPPIPVGKAELELRLSEFPLTVSTYRPPRYDGGPLIIVCHGVLRNADEYRDHAVSLGDRFGALIVAPKFDEERFPLRKYQHGGIVADGQAVPVADRTGSYLIRLVDEVRRRERRPELPYFLIGHSGGGQFLFRTAAFVPLTARGIVASNSGTITFPRSDWGYPYGLGGLPDELTTDAVLRRFLAQPITLYLGQGDTERDEHLDVSPEADRQGTTRLERNRNAFEAWRQLAREKQWEFRWRLVEVEGIGHDHEKMFDHPRVREALFGAAPLP